MLNRLTQILEIEANFEKLMELQLHDRVPCFMLHTFYTVVCTEFPACFDVASDVGVTEFSTDVLMLM